MALTIVYGDELLAYDMGNGHPFRPDRAPMSVSLLDAYGLIGPDGPIRLAAPRPASRDRAMLFHSDDYLTELERASEDPDSVPIGHYGLATPDVPAFLGMYAASLLLAGATCDAVDMAAVRGKAFAPSGGTHHAHRSMAHGFCVLNDAAIAIAGLIDSDPHIRVAYVDIDAHHGDGVQEAFWNEPRVLTASVHGSGSYLYPRRGFPVETGGPGAPLSAANVGLPGMAGDECYRLAWYGALLPAIERFRPDLIVAQLGIDTHMHDWTNPLYLSLPGYESMVRRIVEVSNSLCEGRLAATGGGGYGLDLASPRAWAMAAASMVGARLPETLPAGWVEGCMPRVEAGMGLEYADECLPMREEMLRALGSSWPRSLRDDGPLAEGEDPEETAVEVAEAIRLTVEAVSVSRAALGL